MGLRGPAPERDAKIIQLKGMRVRSSKPPAKKVDPLKGPIPRCPQWLGERAKAEWKRVAPELHRTGRLTALDVAALSGYCQCHGMYQQCLETIANEGISLINARGAHVKHPLLSVAQASRRDMLMFAREFGITPLSRDRVAMPDETPPGDPFDQWLQT